MLFPDIFQWKIYYLCYVCCFGYKCENDFESWKFEEGKIQSDFWCVGVLLIFGNYAVFFACFLISINI